MLHFLKKGSIDYDKIGMIVGVIINLIRKTQRPAKSCEGEVWWHKGTAITAAQAGKEFYNQLPLNRALFKQINF